MPTDSPPKMNGGFATNNTPTKQRREAIASNHPHFSFSIQIARKPVNTGAMKVSVVASPTYIYLIEIT